MTINTGGVDVTQQTGGVGINLVTKSGTRPLQGLVALLQTTDEKFESQEHRPTRCALQGATSGNPIQDIKDYGIEVGGPIKKGKAWVWGSFGKQNIDVGVARLLQADGGLPGVRRRRRSRWPRRSTTSTAA